MLKLYTATTPNGWKASVTLEELGLPYEVHAIDLAADDQKQPWFLEINPNGRIPALVDPDYDNLPIFESAAIMIHLCEKTGSDLLPTDPIRRARVMSWLMFQMGGVGPMMGQANVFYRYWPEKVPSVIDRYQNECRRLFKVLDGQLGRTDWLAGEYSIADIANWCWVRIHHWPGISVDELPHFIDWMERMAAREACQKGIAVPEPLVFPEEVAGSEVERLANSIITK